MDKFLEHWILKTQTASAAVPVALRLKEGAQISSLTKPVSVETKWNVHRGPRWEFAKTNLKFEPSKDFFVTIPEHLPAKSIRFAEGLIFGILEILTQEVNPPLLGLKITVLEVTTHEVDSTVSAFINAGKQAAKELLMRSEIETVEFSEQHEVSISKELMGGDSTDSEIAVGDDPRINVTAKPVAIMERPIAPFGDELTRTGSLEIHFERVRLIQAEQAQTGLYASNIDKNLSERINLAKSQIDEGKVLSAKALLMDLTPELDARPKELQFKVFNNLGVIDLSSNNLDSAANYFKTAIDLMPDSAIGYSNAAQVSLLQNNHDNAADLIKKAVKLDQGPQVLAVALLVFFGAKDSIELQNVRTLHKQIIENSSVCMLALGQNALDEDDFQTAEQCLLEATKLEQENSQAHCLLALSQFIPLQRHLLANPPVHGKPAPNEISILISVESSLTQAISELRKTELFLRLNSALTFRAGIRNILGKTNDAIADLQDVLKQDAANIEAQLSLGRILMLTGDYPAAETILLRLGQQNYDAVDPLLSEVYFRQGKLDEALTVQRRTISNAPKSPLYYQVFDRLIETEWRLGNSTNVDELRRKLAQQSKESAEATYVLAQQAKRENKFDEAVGFLELAAGQATTTLRFWYYRDLAQYIFDKAVQLYDTNREQSKQFFGKTTQWFEKIIDWNKDSPELREYITALANAGNEERAAQLAKSLRLRLGQAIPVLSEIEAKYYADSQKLSSVVEVLESLCIVEPQNIFHRINLVTANIFLKNFDRARAVLLTIGPVSDPQHARVIDNLRKQLGL